MCNTQNTIKKYRFPMFERNLGAASVVGFVKSRLNSPARGGLELQEIYILIAAEDKTLFPR